MDKFYLDVKLKGKKCNFCCRFDYFKIVLVFKRQIEGNVSKYIDLDKVYPF